MFFQTLQTSLKSGDIVCLSYAVMEGHNHKELNEDTSGIVIRKSILDGQGESFVQYVVDTPEGSKKPIQIEEKVINTYITPKGFAKFISKFGFEEVNSVQAKDSDNVRMVSLARKI